MRLALSPDQIGFLAQAGDAAALAVLPGAGALPGTRIALEADQCSLAALKALYTRLDGDRTIEAEQVMLHQRLGCWLEMAAFDGPQVMNLSHLLVQLVAYVKGAPHHYLMREDASGTLVPWYVAEIKLVREKDNPHVSLRLEASVLQRRLSENVVFFGRSIGDSVARLLAAKRCYRLPAAMVDDCLYQMELATELAPTAGVLVRAQGPCLTAGLKASLLAASERAVVDVTQEPDTSKLPPLSAVVSSEFWSNRKGSVRPPAQPYVRLFCLDLHEVRLVHVDRTARHRYQPEALRRVVIPEHTRQLLNAVVAPRRQPARRVCSLIIFRGPSGTGKTMTAEAFAECAGKPLYRVSCAQLGTNEVELEARLSEVLRRAADWNAVLLIDEADVYVKPRTDDIRQDAIVGTFLRLLERHTSTVILTTNRASLDVAVVSRALVLVEFQLPSEADRVRIIQSHAETLGLSLNHEEASWMAKSYAGSGRELERMLNLAHTIHGADDAGSPFQTLRGTLEFLISPVDEVGRPGGSV